MHAQRDHAAYLRGREAHYLITIKANQPGVHQQLKALPWANVPVAHTSREKGHGRIENDNSIWIWIWPTFRDETGPPGGQRVSRIRLRRRSNLARPYICRLIILMRLTLPSTAPELWAVVSPAMTASQSRLRPAVKEFRSGWSSVSTVVIRCGAGSHRLWSGFSRTR
jgi:hypothetical protein